MTLWRISNHPILDGRGGFRTSGRWHTRGRAVVYCAPNPATALVEVLVHLEIDAEDIPVSLRYLEIETPNSTSKETVALRALATRWRTELEFTQHIGDEWLASGRSAMLRVPCAIVPATMNILNILINPQHPDSAKIAIRRIHKQSIDSRLGPRWT